MTTEETLKDKLAKKGKCNSCAKEISIYRRFASGKMNRLPFKLCPTCYRDKKTLNSSSISTEESPIEPGSAVSGFFIGAIEPDQSQPDQDQFTTGGEGISSLNSVVLSH